MTAPDLAELKHNPSANFKTPIDVVRDLRLSLVEKREILEAWEQEARHMAESTAENMGGGEDGRLRDVTLARLELDKLDPDKP